MVRAGIIHDDIEAEQSNAQISAQFRESFGTDEEQVKDTGHSAEQVMDYFRQCARTAQDVQEGVPEVK